MTLIFILLLKLLKNFGIKTKVLQYTLQGLFHPARKVREVYWKIYNNLYIGSQAALVPAYPRMTDDVLNQYTRSHLELFL